MIDQAEWMNEWIAIDQGNLFFHLSMHLKDYLSNIGLKEFKAKTFWIQWHPWKNDKVKNTNWIIQNQVCISPASPSKYEKKLKLLNAVVFTSAWPFSS